MKNKRLADRATQRMALLELVIAGGDEATRAAYLLIEEYAPHTFDTFVLKCFPKGIVQGPAFDALADAWDLHLLGDAIKAAPEVAAA